MRSKVYRFSEFRTSRCVSQFAASFIGTRAKVSTGVTDNSRTRHQTVPHEAAKRQVGDHTRRYDQRELARAPAPREKECLE